MTVNETDPDNFDRINIMNLELSKNIHDTLLKITNGVCEGYPDKSPFAQAMIQLMTVIRYSTNLQTTMIEAVMYGLEELGLMRVVPDEAVIASPEFQALQEHFKRRDKPK